MKGTEIVLAGWLIMNEEGRLYAVRQAPYVVCWWSQKKGRFIKWNEKSRKIEVSVPQVVLNRLRGMS